MNEEEIRAKLLLPYLQDLGFDLSEIALETSFSIRLGKSTHTISGRSDILCKRNGKNLFIIELKNDRVAITQEDIDQGVSYARLLSDNIAPFTLISNAKITRVFDSITRQELTGTAISKQSSYWQDDCTLSTDIDLAIRYEALKKFVSFSPENLRRFCEHQVQGRMGSIIGDIDQPYAKFIQQLHVQRQDLEKSFAAFASSSASVFGIVGMTGVGKTSAMCSLALQQLDNHLVFFYNAPLISQSPLVHIGEDLNGFFSSRNESDVVLRKLDELGKFLGKQVFIFIDAIDESINSHLFLDLSDMALAIKNLEKVKLCISCKSNLWSTLLKRNDTPTHLFRELGRFHPEIPSVDNCPGYLLENFSDPEITRIIPLYQEVFDFRGQLSPSVLEALRNGFFLRIFSEVYSHRPVPQKINDRQLIKKYLQLSLGSTALSFEKGIRILARIGKIFLNHHYDRWDFRNDNGIATEHLLEELSLDLSESIPEDLFTRNILIRSNNEDSNNVTFYYSKIRDYIICFHSYALDRSSDQAFYQLLEKFYANYIGQSAIAFYTDNASTSHQRMLIAFKEDKALQYVNRYTDYIEKHFNSFKSKFDPYTEGDIGIYLPDDSLHKDGYALFRRSSSLSPKVQFAPIGDFLSQSYDDIFERGVNSVHSSNHALLSGDQDKVVRKSIFEELKKIIDKGDLSVYTNDTLLFEQVATIIYYYSKHLQYPAPPEDYYLPRFNSIYPIDLRDVKRRAFAFRVREYYQGQYHLDQQERNRLIEQALQHNIEIPPLRIRGSFPPIEELEKIVEILLHKGYEQLQQHFLPCPDTSVAEIKQIFHSNQRLDIPAIRTLQFSEMQAKLYMESFFKHFDPAYRAFVESSFPLVKERFPFYLSGPHEYFVYMKDEDVLKWGYYGYRPSVSGEVQVHFRKMRAPNEPFPSEETHILHGFSLNHILYNDNYPSLKTIDGFNTPKLDDYCILRYWVYKFLKRDMSDLFKEVKD